MPKKSQQRDVAHAHREVLDEKLDPWRLQAHAVNGMPAYSRNKGRHTMHYEDGFYVVRSPLFGNEPLTLEAAQERAGFHTRQTQAGFSEPRQCRI